MRLSQHIYMNKHRPGWCVFAFAETLNRRLDELRRFEAARLAAGLPPANRHKFPSWLSNLMAKSQHRMLRLHFLMEQVRLHLGD